MILAVCPAKNRNVKQLIVEGQRKARYLPGFEPEVGAEANGPGRRQRTARPPQMQTARMRSNSRHFLIGAGLVDGIKRKGYFDEFFR